MHYDDSELAALVANKRVNDFKRRLVAYCILQASADRVKAASVGKAQLQLFVIPFHTRSIDSLAFQERIQLTEKIISFYFLHVENLPNTRKQSITGPLDCKNKCGRCPMERT